MSTAAVSTSSTSSIFNELQTFFQNRRTDLQQLGQALQSSDLAGAQQAFNAIVTLGQSGPFANANPFRNSIREQDFTAIGQALQSGDLAGAQQAFAQLESTFHQNQAAPPPLPPAFVINITEGASRPSPASTPSSAAKAATPPTTSSPASTNSATTSSNSGAVPEIVVNLQNNSGSSEQVTIDLSRSPQGSEQLTIQVGQQQPGITPEQVTFNFQPNSNEQIVVNLLNSNASNSSQGSGLNVVA